MNTAKRGLPELPIPSAGEILYTVVMASGLVSSSAASDKHLYAQLRAFKDERLRPGLNPDDFRYVLEDVADRLAAFTLSEDYARVTIEGLGELLQMYSAITDSSDACLLDRQTALDEVLWSTLFSLFAVVFLGVAERGVPLVNPIALVTAEAPLGLLIRALADQGSRDLDRISEYRADKANIDKDNCRDTLDAWLTGTEVPSLGRCEEILEALDLRRYSVPRIWILIARMLQKTPKRFRGHIEARLRNPSKVDVISEYRQRLITVGCRIGSQLDIGHDRPYPQLLRILYDPEAPRDPGAAEDMLARLERTWAPIPEHTRHTILWLRARYLVLRGEPDAALPLYTEAYDWGCRRDGDIAFLVDEALALARHLRARTLVKRFSRLMKRYAWAIAERGSESPEEHFARAFNPGLYFAG